MRKKKRMVKQENKRLTSENSLLKQMIKRYQDESHKINQRYNQLQKDFERIRDLPLNRVKDIYAQN